MNREVQRNFDRETVPALALSRWNAQPDSLEPVREGANFVYRFLDATGIPRYLRLTHAEHRNLEEVAAELEFVVHLARQGIPVARPIPSKVDAVLEVLPFDTGYIFAVAWEAVQGQEVSWGTDAHNRQLLFERGQSLGRLHRASQSFQPKQYRRTHWHEDNLFTDPEKYLPESEPIARREYEELLRWMSGQSQTPDNYGMIHGDYGSCNTLRRADGSLAVYDFDDCGYHWFMYDIAVTMRARGKLPDKYRKPYLKVLLEGYATEMTIGPYAAIEVGMFSRLAALYRFVTTLREHDGNVAKMNDNQRALLDERRGVIAHPPAWY